MLSFDKDLTEFQKNFVIRAITNHTGNGGVFPYDSPFTLEMKINGIEVDALQVMTEYVNELDKHIQIEAEMLVRGKFGALARKLDDLSVEVGDIESEWRVKIRQEAGLPYFGGEENDEANQS